MKRIDVLEENTWDLSYIYKVEENVYKDLEKCQKIVDLIVNNRQNLFLSEGEFDKTMNYLFEYELLITKVYTYAHHKLDEEISNQDSQKLFNIAYSKYIDYSQSLNFLTPKIMENKDLILSYLADDKYKDLRKYFDNIFRFSKYTLSQEEEKIISLTANMSSLAYKAYNSLVDSEFEYKGIIDGDKTLDLTQGTYNNYITSGNRSIREQAFKNLYEPFKKHIDTLSILYNGQINTLKFSTKARGYESNIQNSLYSTNINLEVYKNLVNTVNQNININHEYVKLRKEKLGLKQMHLYDMYVPLVKDLDREITFKESKKIILDCFSILGKDYTKGLEEAFSNRWIDIYENEAKRSGAYSGGMYTSPPYILLNYTNKINDLYTLAHELGHSMHTYYTNQSQKIYNSHYKIFIAEVASIVNELLLTDYLLKTSDDKKYKAYILNYLLEQFRTTLIRQTMFAEFEIKTNDKVEKTQDLTAGEFNEIYYELNKTYFGEDVVIDEEIKYEWSRIPHFYYEFYVYQYATSFCAAIKIKNNILKDEKFKEKYLDFLKMGDSVYPLEALKILGIDLEHSSSIKEAMQEYEKTLNEFKELDV